MIIFWVHWSVLSLVVPMILFTVFVMVEITVRVTVLGYGSRYCYG